MKIGDLASKLSISTRTLRWYEDKGLFQPAYYNAAGHRCYDLQSLQRLQQILSLKSLGFSLNQIDGLINQKNISLQEVIERHLIDLEKNIEASKALYQKLSTLSNMIKNNDSITEEDYIDSIKVTIMFEKNYTKEQLDELKGRGQSMGPELVNQAQQNWPKLIQLVKQAMADKKLPSDPAVKELAKQWQELLNAFTGANPGIEKSLRKSYQQNSESAKQMGLDPEVFAYIKAAMD